MPRSSWRWKHGGAKDTAPLNHPNALHPRKREPQLLRGIRRRCRSSSKSRSRPTSRRQPTSWSTLLCTSRMASRPLQAPHAFHCRRGWLHVGQSVRGGRTPSGTTRKDPGSCLPASGEAAPKDLKQAAFACLTCLNLLVSTQCVLTNEYIAHSYCVLREHIPVVLRVL